MLRESMQLDLRRIQQELGITAVYVTHDQSEAMNMSDRIAVMNHGVLEQIGTAEQIYDRPRTQVRRRFCRTDQLLAGNVDRGGKRLGNNRYAWRTHQGVNGR